MASTLKDPVQVFLLAPEDIIDILIKLVPSSWNIIIGHNIEECREKLDNNSAALIVYDALIKDKPQVYLDEFRELVVHTEIILFRRALDVSYAIDLFNEDKIDRLIDLSSESSEPKKVLRDAVESYLSSIAGSRQQELIDKRIDSPRDTLLSEDRIVDLSIALTDSKEIKDFSTQFLSMLQGLQSFISVNYSIFQDKKEPVYQETMFEYLSDLELLANQYDQKILLIYVEITRAYLYLADNKVDQAMSHYKNSVRVFYWISIEYIDDELVSIINSFPILEDEYYYIKTGEKEFKMDLKMKLELRNKINILLDYDLSRLTNLSETLYNTLKIQSDVILSLLVVRDSLPLYVFDNVEEQMDPALVSGFVDALSTFLQELVAGKGDIDHISHDKGVILIHQEGNIRYLLVASADEVFLRMGLRQFAKETIDEMSSIPPNDEASTDQYEQFSAKIRDLFRIKDLGE